MEMRNAPWGQEDTATLLRLWCFKSAAEIAKQMQRSRSAICGKVSRLKKEGAIASDMTKEFLKKKTPRPPSQPKPKLRVVPPPPPIHTRVEYVSDPCTLLELDFSRCRWPLGDTYAPVKLFCGAVPEYNGRPHPYCPAHMNKAFDRKRRTP